MKKRLLTIAICLIMLCGLLALSAGANAVDHADHTCVPSCGHIGSDPHKNVAEWTGWTDTDTLPTTAGNYYLTNDVTLTGTWNVPTGGVTLCLNGKFIKMNADADVITIGAGAILTLTDCDTTAGKITHVEGKIGRGVQVNGGTFNMYGGSITGNVNAEANDYYVRGGGVYVNNGTFNMYGGTISNNKAVPENLADTTGRGGGVYVGEQATFTISGGTITENTAKFGGGVHVEGDDSSGNSTLTVSGGTITGNVATFTGGGVYVNWGTFTMSGSASIEYNTADFGGGVHLQRGSTTFNMSGGTICNNEAGYGGGMQIEYSTFTMSGSASIEYNRAEYGGAVYVAQTGAVTMSGGTIIDNTANSKGGGVYFVKGNTFSISGNPVITGNKVNSAASNVLLYDEKVITVNDELTSGATIGISMKTDGVFTSGNAEDYASYFESDDDSKRITPVGGELKLEKITYTVTFNSNGGSAVDTQQVEHGGKVSEPSAPTRDGYTFGGWYLDDGIFENQWIFNTNTVTGDGVTLYAKWTEIPTYTVTYYANGATSGTAPTDVTAHYEGSPVTVQGAGSLTKTGHNFAGWNTKADGSGTDYAAGAEFEITADTTLYAKWEPKSTVISIIIEPAEGGTATGSGTYYYGETAHLTATANPGYSVDGWFLGETRVANAIYYDAAITGDVDTVTYTVRFFATPTITITANPAEGGTISGPSSGNYQMGLEFNLIANPNAGYTFVNWTKNGTEVSTEATLTVVVNGAANYVANFAPITYTVTFDSNDGSAVDTQQVEHGGKVSEPSAPTRDGYTFGGWYLDDGIFENQWIFNTNTVTGDGVTLYAKWTEIPTYTVTFNANGHGEAPDAISDVEYGDKITAPTAPEAPGWIFGGWYKDAGCNNAWNFDSDTVNATTTLYAKWTQAHYHCVCGATHANVGDHTAEQPITWTAWNGGDIPYDNNNVAYVYLSADISRTLIIEDGHTLYLCLHGNKWQHSNGGYTICINGNGALYLCDCDRVGGGLISQNRTNSTTVYMDGRGNRFVMYGGKVTHTFTGPAAAVSFNSDNAGTSQFIMYGGSVTGASANGAVVITKNATFTMMGGSVRNTNGKAGVAGFQDNKVINFTISGTVDIDKIALKAGQKITIGAGGFNTQQPIEVSSVDNGSDKPLTSGWGTHMSGEDFAEYFECADTGYYFSVPGGEIVKLASTYTVTFNANGGTVDTENGPATYDSAYGTLPTPTRAGYTFAGWYTKDGTNDDWGTEVTSATIVKTGSNHTLYAKWTEIPTHNILVVADNDAYGTVTGGGTYEEGTEVTLTATPNDGYVFAYWTKLGVDGAVSTDASYTITITEGAKYFANFAPVYTVTVTNGTTDKAEAIEGATVTLTADAPATGKVFDKWVVTGATVANETATTTTFTMPDGNVTAEATYKNAPVTPPSPPSPPYVPPVVEHECESICSICGKCTDKACTETACAEKCDGDKIAFVDIRESAWYAEAVEYVSHLGLMNGVSDSEFAPEMTTSRAMIVTILWRLENEPGMSVEDAFEDVESGAWYAEAVAWAEANGIITGYDNGDFGPNDAITREQLATILYRYEKYKGGGFTGSWMYLLDYADRADVSDWAYEAMCWNTMNGIIQGKDGNMLDPKGTAKRGEAALVLMRYLEK